jgi:hypothetical protein
MWRNFSNIWQTHKNVLEYEGKKGCKINNLQITAKFELPEIKIGYLKPRGLSMAELPLPYYLYSKSHYSYRYNFLRITA